LTEHVLVETARKVGVEQKAIGHSLAYNPSHEAEVHSLEHPYKSLAKLWIAAARYQ